MGPLQLHKLIDHEMLVPIEVWAEVAHVERKMTHGLTRYAHSRDRSGTIAALEDQANAALVTLRHKIAAQWLFPGGRCGRA